MFMKKKIEKMNNKQNLKCTIKAFEKDVHEEKKNE